MKYLKKLWKFYLNHREGSLFHRIYLPWVLLFGNIEKKIDYDLIDPEAISLGLKKAFEMAKLEDCKDIILFEFGVASGRGLRDMERVASKLKKIYKINYEIIGFDSGNGMPESDGYRDEPELYNVGDFPPCNLDINKLPSSTSVIYGPIKETISKYMESFQSTSNKKIAYVSIDVDYYSSTLDSLKVFYGQSDNYLSKVVIFFDDINHEYCSEFSGELLAIKDFNKKENILRKISKINFLKYTRIFKNRSYIEHLYFCHIYDHERSNSDFYKNLDKRIV